MKGRRLLMRPQDKIHFSKPLLPWGFVARSVEYGTEYTLSLAPCPKPKSPFANCILSHGPISISVLVSRRGLSLHALMATQPLDKSALTTSPRQYRSRGRNRLCQGRYPSAWSMSRFPPPRGTPRDISGQ